MPQDRDPCAHQPRAERAIPVLLIDAHALMRRCMAKLLVSEAGDFEVYTAASMDDAQLPPVDAVALVMVNANSSPVTDEAVAVELSRARERFPSAPLVVLSRRNDADMVRQAMAHGVRGVIPASSTLPVMIAALRLVLAGGSYAEPAASLADAPMRVGTEATVPAGAARPATAPAGGLTERETEVLALLREGKANKVIAHELHMSENTVKVHVRRIMRKLNVSNRTEAAFFDAPALAPPAPTKDEA